MFKTEWPARVRKRERRGRPETEVKLYWFLSLEWVELVLSACAGIRQSHPGSTVFQTQAPQLETGARCLSLCHSFPTSLQINIINPAFTYKWTFAPLFSAIRLLSMRHIHTLHTAILYLSPNSLLIVFIPTRYFHFILLADIEGMSSWCSSSLLTPTRLSLLTLSLFSVLIVAYRFASWCSKA